MNWKALGKALGTYVAIVLGGAGIAVLGIYCPLVLVWLTVGLSVLFIVGLYYLYR